MGELQAVNDITPFQAILWIFYPMTALVMVELLLRGFDDDDDDDGGKGIRIRSREMVPATVPSGA